MSLKAKIIIRLTTTKTLGEREKRIETGKNKEKRLKSLEEVKALHYMNEHTMFSLMKILGSLKSEAIPFNIIEKIEYVFHLLNSKAVQKDVTLVLMTEPCFPKEVNGDRLKFGLVLSVILDYLITRSSKETEIKLYAKVKDLFEGGFMLGFDFEMSKADDETLEDFKTILTSPTTIIDQWKESIHPISQSTQIIKHLGGNVEIPEIDPQTPKAKILVEIPFCTKEFSQDCTPENKIGIYRYERCGEFTKKWTAIIGTPDKTPMLAARKHVGNFPRSITVRNLGNETALKDKIRQAVSKLQPKPGQVVTLSQASIGGLAKQSNSMARVSSKGGDKESIASKFQPEEVIIETKSPAKESDKQSVISSNTKIVIVTNSEIKPQQSEVKVQRPNIDNVRPIDMNEVNAFRYSANQSLENLVEDVKGTITPNPVKKKEGGNKRLFSIMDRIPERGVKKLPATPHNNSGPIDTEME